MNQIINKPKALIVEDSASLAAFYATALQSAGYETEIMGNGHEADIVLNKPISYAQLRDLSGRFRQIKE